MGLDGEIPKAADADAEVAERAGERMRADLRGDIPEATSPVAKYLQDLFPDKIVLDPDSLDKLPPQAFSALQSALRQAADAINKIGEGIRGNMRSQDDDPERMAKLEQSLSKVAQGNFADLCGSCPFVYPFKVFHARENENGKRGGYGYVPFPPQRKEDVGIDGPAGVVFRLLHADEAGQGRHLLQGDIAMDKNAVSGDEILYHAKMTSPALLPRRPRASA